MKPKFAGVLVHRPLLAAALAATAVASAPAMAAVDIYLKLGDINGESTDNQHKAWIDIFSYSGGVSPGSVAVGNGAARAVAATNCAPLTVKKLFDRASPTLFTAAVTGQHFSKAQFDFVHADAARDVFIKFELNDVVVSATSQSAAAGEGGAATENLSLNFGGVKITYQPQNADGSPGDPVVTQVNCP